MDRRNSLKRRALKEGLDRTNDNIPPKDNFSMFSWWDPWAKEFRYWGHDGKKIDISNLASKEAARRYYFTKVFVSGAGKVFSLKSIRDDNKFFDSDPIAKRIMLNEEPLKKGLLGIDTMESLLELRTLVILAS